MSEALRELVVMGQELKKWTDDWKGGTGLEYRQVSRAYFLVRNAEELVRQQEDDAAAAEGFTDSGGPAMGQEKQLRAAGVAREVHLRSPRVKKKLTAMELEERRAQMQ